MGMLIEGPVALHDIGGVDVTVAEAIVDVGAVVRELHHVSTHVRSVVDSHLVASSVLWGRGTKSNTHNEFRTKPLIKTRCCKCDFEVDFLSFS